MTLTNRKLPSGFALVATLLMMVLLLVVAVGLLGLSSVELRRSGHGKAMERARANAHLGLMIALGELQKNLGPDQRVSADARVASNGSSTPAHAHWVSVWKSTQHTGESWITRHAEEGGLRDNRQTGGSNARDERLTTLVSGNENGTRHQDDDPGNKDDLVRLVGEGSLGSKATDEDYVFAPRVEIKDSPNTKGGYGWWVGDLGAQANIATRDITPDTPSGEHRALMLAQDSSWKAFGKSDIKNEDRAKLVSERQMALVEQNSENRHFHDYTVWSAGLPINVREGGWRKDLTSYMASSGTIADYNASGVKLPGIKDSDNLVGPSNKITDATSGSPGQAKRLESISPKFGLLRKWAERAANAPLGDYSIATELGDTLKKGTGGYNEQSVDFRNRTKSHLMPVLVEGSLYYNLSTYDTATPTAPAPYGLRLHLYPRVVLWNPYNFSLKVPESSIFMHINGAKQVEVTMDGGLKRNYRMFWGLNNNSSETGGGTRGSMFFKMDAATLEPGESAVWSPSKNAIYQEENFASNTLTATMAPSPGRGFYMDNRVMDRLPLFEPLSNPLTDTTGEPVVLVANRAQRRPVEWREVVPPRPANNLQAQKYTQADDYVMSWKPTKGSLNLASFRAQPMGRFVSCAYQYGDEDELPVEWTSFDPVPFARSSLTNSRITEIPDCRTRDGFRLRWSEETVSNKIGSGGLASTSHFDDSPIGNWNMRASWSYRSPFDNVSNLAPNFFGIYTRDLFDDEVDWTNTSPRSSGGKALGDPFDQPIRGIPQRILFDVPRKDTEIASLGAFQHVNLSEFIWHPTYALGNSLVDPRVPMSHTEPDRSEDINRDKGGWNQNSIGYATDGRSDNNGNENRTDEDNWAYSARQYLQQAPLDQSVVYDLSYELNHSLWDGYFLSTGSKQEKDSFLSSPNDFPLPNGRMRPNSMIGKEIVLDEVTDYHVAASRMIIDGAFNVNSTSVSAWEALLLSGVDKKYGENVAFPRFLNAPGGEWSGDDARDPAAWSGQRVFNRKEIRTLAEEIVKQVEERGPFISIGDFVNRRLTEGELGKKGALQAAIDLSKLNGAYEKEWPLDNAHKLPDITSDDNIQDSTRMEQTHKPSTTAWGALGFLTQADLLQFIGPALSARSDTFRIRAYGESRNQAGNIEAKCYCEAVVQRSPKYVDSSDDLLQTGTALSEINKEFGRRFEIVSFRWLKEEEI